MGTKPVKNWMDTLIFSCYIHDTLAHANNQTLALQYSAEPVPKDDRTTEEGEEIDIQGTTGLV